MAQAISLSILFVLALIAYAKQAAHLAAHRSICRKAVKLAFTLGDKPSCWGTKPTANIPPSFGPDGKQRQLVPPAAACNLP